MSYSNYSSNNNNKQLSLFESPAVYQLKKNLVKDNLLMSENFLNNWKKNIYNYQKQERNNVEKQINFINDNDIFLELELFDPFSLNTHPDQFYDLPQYNLSESCLYFILDISANLLLYIGETKVSPHQRWINHDCKSYIQSYIELHRKYQLHLTIRSAFLWGVSSDRKIRQSWEKQLIFKWRSPFNKESWIYWGQPFK